MLARCIAVAFIVAGLTSPSLGARVDFSKVRCEDTEIIKVIEKKMKGAKIQGGQSLASYVTIEKLLKSTTFYASRDKLICTVTVKISSSGGSRQLRGRYTFQQFNSGKLTARWTLIH